MRLAKKLNDLRVARGLSQVQVAAYLTERGSPVTSKAVSSWESGRTEPSVEKFMLLCRLYDVRDVQHTFYDLPLDHLFGVLNDLGRKRAKEYIGLLASDERFSNTVKQPKAKAARKIPLYEIPVSAGSGSFLDSDDFELIEVDETAHFDATYAVRVQGDSMEPLISDNQVLFIKPQQFLDDGEIGIFYYNGDAYCKKYEDEKLISLNSKYAPIIIREYDEFRIYGKVVT